MKKTIYPIVLSGGYGTRLWPLSRASCPKQLITLSGKDTMLQATMKRIYKLRSSSINIEPPVVIGNEEHRFIIREQLHACGHASDTVYLEPIGRNTAPAIGLAALELVKGKAVSNEALMLVLPADHIIQDLSAFSRAVETAVAAAEKGYLVTFGITPTAPETGYGYIKAGSIIQEEGKGTVYEVGSFVEKPDLVSAQAYLESGEFTWNSGMFLFRAERYLEELAMYRPDILEAVTCAWEQRTVDCEFVRPDRELFIACPAESIDYAVMQATHRAAVVPADIGWSDVGSWDALWKIADRDNDQNVTQGDVFVSDVHNSYVRAESRLVAVIGLDDVVVVETPDSVLVMHKDEAQKVRKAVSHFQNHSRREHLEHLRVHRPWGWYESIDTGDRFQVKRIMVKPGGRLSLQMHHHRAEHWVVVSGTAKVTLGDKELLLNENQSTYIPVGQIHRLENPGRIPLHLIEVQSGAYLGEDDIVRFEDVYGR